MFAAQRAGTLSTLMDLNARLAFITSAFPWEQVRDAVRGLSMTLAETEGPFTADTRGDMGSALGGCAAPKLRKPTPGLGEPRWDRRRVLDLHPPDPTHCPRSIRPRLDRACSAWPVQGQLRRGQ